MVNREDIEAKFNKSRANLLMVVILTTINVVLGLTNTDLSFLFSARIPTFFIELGKLFAEEWASQMPLYIGIFIAVAGIAVYGLCYALSKTYKSWILVALILFSIDSLFLLVLLPSSEIDVGLIIDIAFHGWVIFCLVFGVKAWIDLKKAPTAELTSEKKCPFCEKMADKEALFCQFCGGNLQGEQE